MAGPHQKPPIKFNNVKYQYLVLMIINIVVFAHGSAYEWSPRLAKTRVYSLYENAINYMVTVSYCGGIFLGNVIFSLVRCMAGMRNAIYLLVIPNVTCLCIFSMMNSRKEWLVAKMFAGIWTGGFVVTMPLFVGDLADRRRRGSLFCTMTVAVLMGQFTQFCIVSHTNNMPVNFMWMWLHPVFMLLWHLAPDSPMYYLRTNDPVSAEEAWIFYNLGNRWLVDISRSSKHRLVRKFHNMEKFIETETTCLGANDPFQDFMSKTNIRAIFTYICLFGCILMSGAKSLVYIPSASILLRNWSDLHIPHISVIFLAQLFFAMLSVAIIDRIGRRQLLMWAVLVAGLNLFLVGGFEYLHERAENRILHWMAYLLYGVYVAAMSIGVRQMPIILLSELFEPRWRSLSVTVATLPQGLMEYLARNWFLVIDAYMGLHWALWMSSAFCALTAWVAADMLPETLGKDLHLTPEMESLQCIHYGDDINRNGSMGSRDKEDGSFMQKNLYTDLHLSSAMESMQCIHYGDDSKRNSSMVKENESFMNKKHLKFQEKDM